MAVTLETMRQFSRLFRHNLQYLNNRIKTRSIWGDVARHLVYSKQTFQNYFCNPRDQQRRVQLRNKCLLVETQNVLRSSYPQHQLLPLVRRKLYQLQSRQGSTSEKSADFVVKLNQEFRLRSRLCRKSLYSNLFLNLQRQRCFYSALFTALSSAVPRYIFATLTAVNSKARAHRQSPHKSLNPRPWPRFHEERIVEMNHRGQQVPLFVVCSQTELAQMFTYAVSCFINKRLELTTAVFKASESLLVYCRQMETVRKCVLSMQFISYPNRFVYLLFSHFTITFIDYMLF